MASEDFATEGQIKRLYAVLHSVGLDPAQWKKDQNIASYAKLTRAQCSAYIDEVEALEAEQKMQTATGQPQLPQKPDEKGHFGARAEAEADRIRQEQGRAAASAQPGDPAFEALVEKLIEKYIYVLERVTVKVEKSELLPDREKGFATKFLYDSVKGAIDNGGDHEEQV
jgi:hypothetical protein